MVWSAFVAGLISLPLLYDRELCGGLLLPGGDRGLGSSPRLRRELACRAAAAPAACGHQRTDWILILPPEVFSSSGAWRCNRNKPPPSSALSLENQNPKLITSKATLWSPSDCRANSVCKADRKRTILRLFIDWLFLSWRKLIVKMGMPTLDIQMYIPMHIL